jgi:hypothetical protein
VKAGSGFESGGLDEAQVAGTWKSMKAYFQVLLLEYSRNLRPGFCATNLNLPW